MSSKNKLIIGIILVVVIGVIVLILANTKTEDGTMLNFVGTDYRQAEFFANQYSLDFNIKWENNNKYDSGIVISQSIPKGTVVNIGDKFEIVVAK